MKSVEQMEIAVKTPALKLITSFDTQPGRFRFPGLKSDDRTPTMVASYWPAKVRARRQETWRESSLQKMKSVGQMEMTCLLFPSDWQRQSYLVRRWGEHVVTHSQQQLAIRCFMC
jgi:hypothetical protein